MSPRAKQLGHRFFTLQDSQPLVAQLFFHADSKLGLSDSLARAALKQGYLSPSRNIIKFSSVALHFPNPQRHASDTIQFGSTKGFWPKDVKYVTFSTSLLSTLKSLQPDGQ